MAKIITNGELAEITTQILTNPEYGLIDDKDNFVDFNNKLARLIAEYAGGEVRGSEIEVDEEVDFNEEVTTAIIRDDNCPDLTIWDNYDPDGEL